MRTFNILTKPYDEFKVYKKATVEIEEGFTVLIGCNGCGKSTLLNTMEDKLRELKIPVFSFDNLTEGGNHSMEESLFYNNLGMLAAQATSSEGENIHLNLGKTASKLGNFVRKNRSKEELWILMDAIDSGLSIDNIIDFKKNLVDVVLEDNKDKKVYFIVSANEYEMACGEKCFSVQDCKYVDIKNYEDYKKLILKTREWKKKQREEEE